MKSLQKTNPLELKIIPIKSRKSEALSNTDLHKTLSQIHRISIHHGNEIEIISTVDISYLQSENNYTTVVLNSGRSILCSKTLKRFEDRLMASTFMRIHKSYMININHVLSFQPTNMLLQMCDGTKIPVSRNRKHIILDYLRLISL